MSLHFFQFYSGNFHIQCFHCFSFKILVGDPNLSVEFVYNDILEVLRATKHPSYDGVKSYFDVAVLETRPINFTEVSFFVI